MNDRTDQGKHGSVSSEEAPSRSRETVCALELLSFLDRARLAALEERLIGMKMSDASLRARLRFESESRTRELAEAVARAEHAEFEAARAQGIIDSIHGSTTWRIMTRVTAVLVAYPSVRRMLQSGFGIVRRGSRAVRPMHSRERGSRR